MPEPVVFWGWMPPSKTLPWSRILLCNHWPISGDAPPTNIFDHHAAVPPNVQIINYRVSPNKKWALLGGTSTGPNGQVSGNMQLYIVEKNVSQPLQGHAAVFAKVSLSGWDDPAELLYFNEKRPMLPIISSTSWRMILLPCYQNRLPLPVWHSYRQAIVLRKSDARNSICQLQPSSTRSIFGIRRAILAYLAII
jgi:hypothetical protein